MMNGCRVFCLPACLPACLYVLKQFPSKLLPQDLEIRYKRWICEVLLCANGSVTSCLSFSLFDHFSFSLIKKNFINSSSIRAGQLDCNFLTHLVETFHLYQVIV